MNLMREHKNTIRHLIQVATEIPPHLHNIRPAGRWCSEWLYPNFSPCSVLPLTQSQGMAPCVFVNSMNNSSSFYFLKSIFPPLCVSIYSYFDFRGLSVDQGNGIIGKIFPKSHFFRKKYIHKILHILQLFKEKEKSTLFNDYTRYI